MTQNDIEPTPQASTRTESNNQAPTTHSSTDNAVSTRQRWLGRLTKSGSSSTALGLAVGATLAAVSGLLVPAAQSLLFAVAATGFVGSFLLVLLTPKPTVPATTANGVYGAGAANQAALIGELDLEPSPLYVPAAEDGVARLWLLDHQAGAEVGRAQLRTGSVDADSSPLRTDGSDGLVLEPTGSGLVREFERSLSGSLVASGGGSESESDSVSKSDPELEAESEPASESESDAASEPDAAPPPEAESNAESTPLTLAETLAEGLTESLELTTEAVVDDVTHTSATIAVTDCAFGDLEQFDHPVASFLAAGFVAGLKRPVGVTVTSGSGDRADWIIECVWETKADASG